MTPDDWGLTRTLSANFPETAIATHRQRGLTTNGAARKTAIAEAKTNATAPHNTKKPSGVVTTDPENVALHAISERGSKDQ